MADWVSDLPIWMAPIILAGAFLVTFVTYLIVFALAKGERLRAFKAMSPTMLTPLAVVFGLLISFLASQVWSDVNEAREAVLYEASALRTVACSPTVSRKSPLPGCELSSAVTSTRLSMRNAGNGRARNKAQYGHSS